MRQRLQKYRASWSELSWVARFLLVTLILTPLTTPITTLTYPLINPILISGWKQILLLVVFGCQLLSGRHTKKDFITHLKSNDFILAIILLLVYTISLLVTKMRTNNVVGYVLGANFLAAYLMAKMLGRRIPLKDSAFLLKAVAYTGVVLAILGILQALVLPANILTHMGYDPVYRQTAGIPPSVHYVNIDGHQLIRAQGTSRGPNVFGAYLLISLSLITAQFMRRGTKSKELIKSLAMISVLLLGILVSYSRSAIIAACLIIAVCFFIFVQRHWKRNRLIYSLVSIAVALIIVIGTIFSSTIIAFFMHNDSNANTSTSNSSHAKLTVAAAEDVMAHPLGRGVGEAGPASALNGSSQTRIAENYFLQVGQEVGVVGIVIFIYLQAIIFFVLWSGSHSSKGLALALLGISVTNLLLHTWSDDGISLTWWILAGLFMARQKSSAVAKPAN